MESILMWGTARGRCACSSQINAVPGQLIVNQRRCLWIGLHLLSGAGARGALSGDVWIWSWGEWVGRVAPWGVGQGPNIQTPAEKSGRPEFCLY
jgi:hypothetical protein